MPPYDEDEYENEDDVPQSEEEPQNDDDENNEEAEGNDAEEAPAGPPKRKALFVGINYPDSAAPLKGCINDALNMKEFILERGYDEEDTRMLTDDQEDEELRPTKANMIEAMKWLVEGARPGDSFFFHYSGHGSHEGDQDGDEHDGRDESICPADHEGEGNITDDEMHALLVKPLPPGARLTVIFDCCHSGSGIDLPYMYNEEGTLKAPNKQEALESIAYHAARGDKDALELAANSYHRTSDGQANEAHSVTMATRTSCADVVFLSGCQDEQTSADAFEGGESTGAMTWGLRKIFEEDPEQTYQSLLAKLREVLTDSTYHQRPQLSTAYPMDLELPVVF